MTVKSALFEEFRSGWPSRPYPMMVDHLDVREGRVCPAASLYAFGRQYGDRLREAGVEPGDVVACLPRTWIHWVGMLQACLRRGAVFAGLAPHREAERAEWPQTVEASVVLTQDGLERAASTRRLPPNGIIVGPPAIALTEAELLEVTDPEVVDPMLEPQGPVWLDGRLAPLAEALAVITLLRAGSELHLGLDTEEVFARAEDDHRLFGGGGSSCTLAAARSWAPFTAPSR